MSVAGFAGRVRELVAGNSRLELCMEALLRCRQALIRELHDLHLALLRIVKNDEVCRAFSASNSFGLTSSRFKLPYSLQQR